MKFIMNRFHIMKFILDFITGQCTRFTTPRIDALTRDSLHSC